MDQTPTLEDILAEYNSIARSRRRWYRNRVTLRNDWKELYALLEAASGRTTSRVVVFDPNWHEIAPKGVVSGAVNRIHGQDTEEAVELEANEGLAITEADHSEDPLFAAQDGSITVTDESAPENVEVRQAPAKKPAKKKVAKKKK